MAPSKDGFSRERRPVTHHSFENAEYDNRTVVGTLYIKDGRAMIGSTFIGDLKSKQTANKIRSVMAKALLTK